MSLLSYCFPSPHVYLTHDPPFRTEWAFITKATVGCQLSSHSRLVHALSTLGNGLCCFKTVSGAQTSLVVTRVPQSIGGSGVLLSCIQWSAGLLQQSSVSLQDKS